MAPGLLFFGFLAGRQAAEQRGGLPRRLPAVGERRMLRRRRGAVFYGRFVRFAEVEC